jgi:hypothetical protein
VVAASAALSACRRGPTADELGHQAAQAMADYRAAMAQETVPLRDGLSALSTDLAMDPAGAPAVVAQRVLPSLDHILAAADRALERADAYVATGAVELDAHTRANLDSIRRRTASLHQLRDVVALARAPLDRDAAQRVLSRLGGAGLILTVDP